MPHDPPLAGQVLTARRIQNLDTQGTYTPELTALTTDPNLGDAGETSGVWHRNGHLITAWIRFRFSGTGVDAGSGNYRISVPFDADSTVIDVSGSSSLGHTVGAGRVVDVSSPANSQTVAAQFANASLLFLTVHGSNTAVGDATPMVWADNDRISIFVVYPIDPSTL